MSTITSSSSNLTHSSLFSLSPSHNHHYPNYLSFTLPTRRNFISNSFFPSLHLTSHRTPRQSHHFLIFSTLENGGGGGVGNTGGGGVGGGGGGEEESGDAGERNKREAIMALAEAGRSFDSIPKDLAASIEAGRIPSSIVLRYFELEKSPLLRWLLNFGGFKERLLADDLFLTKVAIECGVGIFTKVLR